MNWLMFGDGDRETLEAWEQSVSCCLRKAIPDVAGIRLRLPSCEEASFAMKSNLDLTGGLDVAFRDGEILRHEIPLPYHGVFVRRGADAENRSSPKRMVWSGWLGEMPGIRMARVANGKTELRLGLPDGRFVVIDRNRYSKSNDLTDVPFAIWWAGLNWNAYGDELLDVLARHGRGSRMGGDERSAGVRC